MNIFFSFPDQAAPLILRNNLRVVLCSEPGKFKNIETWQKLGILMKIVCLVIYIRFEYEEKMHVFICSTTKSSMNAYMQLRSAARNFESRIPIHQKGTRKLLRKS